MAKINREYYKIDGYVQTKENINDSNENISDVWIEHEIECSSASDVIAKFCKMFDISLSDCVLNVDGEPGVIQFKRIESRAGFILDEERLKSFIDAGVAAYMVTYSARIVKLIEAEVNL